MKSMRLALNAPMYIIEMYLEHYRQRRCSKNANNKVGKIIEESVVTCTCYSSLIFYFMKNSKTYVKKN